VMDDALPHQGTITGLQPHSATNIGQTINYHVPQSSTLEVDDDEAVDLTDDEILKDSPHITWKASRGDTRTLSPSAYQKASKAFDTHTFK
jgi:hypothetical protein